jgi:putative ABC transport system permease protein
VDDAISADLIVSTASGSGQLSQSVPATASAVPSAGMGIALVSSLKQQGITDTVVPASSLVIFLLLSALLGLVAASWPARRAAKLDVLAAIAAE